ncbi:CoA-binding protein [Sharpea azabuensis]|jgi:predicted CoA-binding protein|uniref:CoA-binding protein n=1 Tax=Sharpea azabuensis TaxID=322505 RepID=UPI0013DA5DB3|nr:CoA-binding protein [Sharpea azabuensis]MEE3308664.1 CoA-binding protein [Sharpea azabuensis]
MKSIDILRDFKNFAVLGATIDEEKYGFKIVQRLCEIGKTVYPISPKYEEVNSLKAYKSLLAIERPIDVVVFVINKKFASQYIAEMRELGIGFAWMQPGTYDDNLINDIQSLGITPIKDCVLIVSKEI